MKKLIYVVLFSVLGLLVSAIVHGLIELPLLLLVTSDLDRWGESFIWQNWMILHRYAGGMIWVLGFVGGIYLGHKYWRLIYVERHVTN